MKKTVFSGVQPSGVIHLGNYLGSIKQWSNLQNKHFSLFCVVDLHSITAKKLSRSELKSNILKTAAAYIACGIDPEQAIIFNQSTVSCHAELCWLLSCYTPIGWLNRMTQFKDKAGDDKQQASLGLYSYPVLMAADILLYKANYVPVGDDQRQHLEITRDIAIAFNSHYQQDYFTLPEALISNTSLRIKSLRDGTKKMSKSDQSEYSRINFDDSNDSIRNKIKKAKTDSVSDFNPGSLSDRPEILNMVNIYSSLSNLSKEEICDKMNKYHMEYFKEELADLIISILSPIREKMNNLLNDQSYLHEALKKGTEKATKIASQNIKEIKDIIGFI
ncbi:tryptophan--tRNA ligase [Wolbachia endosymbiont of Chironomus riparius]|uniref:tryptophan--tRNA ligase n=1 Tax=Wolbachia endosymbiont of Chironomus riparius TaxID=2883238 RepID=UPI00209E573A|nr:tryptophan--tRNA ligase [Wolbachia endosymbiont of Chironomus riparius]